MNENKKILEFLPSYLLDMLYFLEMLCSNSLDLATNEEEQMIHYFEECLTKEATNDIRRIQKLIPKGERLTTLLIPLVLADPDFENLQPIELLGSPKFLISMYKISPHYQGATKNYKKFIKREAEVLINSLIRLITELERVKFKMVWLEKRLPKINQKIKEYESEIKANELIPQINEHWGEDYITSLKVYLLSFNMDLFVSRMNQSLVCSLQLSPHDFIKSWMEQLILPVMIKQDLKPMYRSLKKNKELKQAYKGLKSTYPSLRDYIEFNGKLAFLTFVCQQLGILDQPYEYLINYEDGTCRPAILFYEFMSRSLKDQGQSVDEYIAHVILSVELDSYGDRSMMILNQ